MIHLEKLWQESYTNPNLEKRQVKGVIIEIHTILHIIEKVNMENFFYPSHIILELEAAAETAMYFTQCTVVEFAAP